MTTRNPQCALPEHLLVCLFPHCRLTGAPSVASPPPYSLVERMCPQAAHIANAPAQICTVWFPSCHLAPVSTHLIHSDSCHANAVLASAKAEWQGESEATRTAEEFLECVWEYDLYIPAIFPVQPCRLVTVRLRDLWYMRILKSNLSESDKKINVEHFLAEFFI